MLEMRPTFNSVRLNSIKKFVNLSAVRTHRNQCDYIEYMSILYNYVIQFYYNLPVITIAFLISIDICFFLDKFFTFLSYNTLNSLLIFAFIQYMSKSYLNHIKNTQLFIVIIKVQSTLLFS